MALPYPFSTSQVDRKSPLNENLFMLRIKANMEYLEANMGLAGTFPYQFKFNGFLSSLSTDPLNRGEEFASFARKNRVDGALISNATTFTSCKIFLGEPGIGGTLECDVRRYTKPDALITGVERLFSGAISSIGRAGSGISTQSIARATPQISTQSISRWKSAATISSIVPLGADQYGRELVRINFSTAIDSDWSLSNNVEVASATDAGNNGTFTIVRAMDDGESNVVIENSSGVSQAGAAGNVELNAWKFVYTNPVSSDFAADEVVTMASHTDAANNGAKTIITINSGGNNIVVRGTGAAQAGAVGNANTNRWNYAFSSAAPADYVVGETVTTTGHTTGANNSTTLPIRAVNQSGNNIIVYNASGAIQAGAAGTVNTNRWIYAFSTDPSTGVTAGDSVLCYSGDSTLNYGDFVVKEVNRSAGTNIVVHNSNGTAQAGANGTMYSKKAKVKFASAQADITTDSRITLFNTAKNADTGYSSDGDFQVLAVNLGGGANYNAVIETLGAEQFGACGRVVMESKSLFDTLPSIVVPPRHLNFSDTHAQVSTNAVLNATRAVVPSGTLLMMDITGIPLGQAKNVVVQLN